jgi:hypothetical protein
MISILKRAINKLSPGLWIGIVFGFYPGFRIYEYTWKSAEFCTQCHVHDYVNVAWKKGIHGDFTTCHDCHHQPLRAYIKEMYIMATNPPIFPKDLHHTPHVSNQICNSCHLSVDADRSTITGPMLKKDIDKIPKVDLSFQHHLHLSKKTNLKSFKSHKLSDQERSMTPQPIRYLPQNQGEERMIECADCHGGPSNRGHNFQATDQSCVRCHQDVHKSEMSQKFGCRSCHYQDFLTPIKSKK